MGPFGGGSTALQCLCIYRARARGGCVHPIYPPQDPPRQDDGVVVALEDGGVGTIWGHHMHHMQVVYRESTLSLSTCIQEEREHVQPLQGTRDGTIWDPLRDPDVPHMGYPMWGHPLLR